MMKTILISRRQYDLLVTQCAAWMQAHWGEYSKAWSIGGVEVTAEGWRIDNLQCQLQP